MRREVLQSVFHIFNDARLFIGQGVFYVCVEKLFQKDIEVFGNTVAQILVLVNDGFLTI